jgi:hypothetical protein
MGAGLLLMSLADRFNPAFAHQRRRREIEGS